MDHRGKSESRQIGERLWQLTRWVRCGGGWTGMGRGEGEILHTCILKDEPIGFADGLVMECERTRGVKSDPKGFV